MYPGRVTDRAGVTGEQKAQKAQIREALGKYLPETKPAVRQLAAERRHRRRG